MKSIFLIVVVVTLWAQDLKAQVDYDIVYVRQARFGDVVNTTWPEIFHPGRMDPGADFMI